MIADRYVWFAWSGLFLLTWLALYAARPRLRPLMFYSSLLTLPFGLSEPFFLMRYWNPPSLFDLTRLAHTDVETFVFCWSIGGTAASLYHVAAGRPVLWRRMTGRERPYEALHAVALLAPVPAFAAVLFATQDLIWAGVAGFFAGAATRVASRPDLAAKVVFGALLFFAYYSALFLLLRAAQPGYVGRYWNMRGPAGLGVGGLPVSEMLFALGFGAYLSGLCEQIDWALASAADPSAGAVTDVRSKRHA